MPVTVRAVPVELILDLRHRLLRAGLPAASAKFAGDDSAVHLAAYDGERLVGCATLTDEPYDGQPAWRLRGMAVEADTQGLGVGRQLLAAIDRAVANPPADAVARPLWCHARLPAVGFYERCGWACVSDVYDIPTAGPHRTMVRQR